MTPRKLAVKSERLTELTTDDLVRVAGAVQQTLLLCSLTCPSYRCTTAQSCTCEPSWNCS